MTEILRSTSFSLLGLTLLDVGPLRGETRISFRDDNGNPTNLYIVMGPNGAGKTTVLEAVHTCMSLLAAKEHPRETLEALGVRGAIQLDALVTLDDGQRSSVRLLSIIAGRPGRLRVWKREELLEVGAEGTQIALQFDTVGQDGPVSLSVSRSDAEATAFHEGIIASVGEPPLSLFGGSINLPTLLYFPSDRGIRRPPTAGRAIVKPVAYGYRPAHRFGVDGDDWGESIENLLVWFTWLDPTLEQSCRDTVNGLVFKSSKKRLRPVVRQTLDVPVEAGDEVHRMDQLSSGERQLVQLVVRIAAHMTGSTIVLIDELEQHLHTVMRRRLVTLVKDWARTLEGISFIMTSHQVDSMRILAPRRPEDGLRKSGCLVRPKFRPPNV